MTTTVLLDVFLAFITASTALWLLRLSAPARPLR
jgi:hypothetical protein